jgi:hypothetical protein
MMVPFATNDNPNRIVKSGIQEDESATTEATEQRTEVTENHDARNRVFRLFSVASVVEHFRANAKRQTPQAN